MGILLQQLHWSWSTWRRDLVWEGAVTLVTLDIGKAEQRDQSVTVPFFMQRGGKANAENLLWVTFSSSGRSRTLPPHMLCVCCCKDLNKRKL